MKKITKIGKDMEKLYTSGVKGNWFSHCGKHFGSFFPSRYMTKRSENRDSNKYMHLQVHSTILHNCKDGKRPIIHQ